MSGWVLAVPCRSDAAACPPPPPPLLAIVTLMILFEACVQIHPSIRASPAGLPCSSSPRRDGRSVDRAERTLFRLAASSLVDNTPSRDSVLL